MCPLVRALSTASSSCLTPSPYLSGPLSFRQQMLPLCRISSSTSSSPSQEFYCLHVSDEITIPGSHPRPLEETDTGLDADRESLRDPDLDASPASCPQHHKRANAAP